MRRRKQCPAIPAALTGRDGWRCQRLADHVGPHRASYSHRSRMHWEWEDGAHIFAYRTRPGAVRFRTPFWTVERAPRLIANTLIAALEVCATIAMWLCAGPLSAAVYALLAALGWVEKAHYVDVGRFTAMVFPVRRDNFPPSFAVGFSRYGPEADAGRSGLQIVIGRRSVLLAALLPRNEWRAHKLQKAEFERQRAERAAGKEAQG